MFWNPWHGCVKCSPGCKNCFVFFLDEKRGRDASIITKNKTDFGLPQKKDRNGNYKLPPGTEVATCFTSDFFLEQADEWRDEAWKLIKSRPDVMFLICTKRIHRLFSCIPDDFGDGYDNVAVAVSCETTSKAEERLPYLIDAPVKHKYVFVSPILEYVELDKFLKSGKIERVVVGGESYDNARVCDFDWVRRIYKTCVDNGVEFGFHQTGSNFVMDGRHYKIPHREEHSQAKKAMTALKNELD